MLCLRIYVLYWVVVKGTKEISKTTINTGQLHNNFSDNDWLVFQSILQSRWVECIFVMIVLSCFRSRKWLRVTNGSVYVKAWSIRCLSSKHVYVLHCTTSYLLFAVSDSCVRKIDNCRPVFYKINRRTSFCCPALQCCFKSNEIQKMVNKNLLLFLLLLNQAAPSKPNRKKIRLCCCEQFLIIKFIAKLISCSDVSASKS